MSRFTTMRPTRASSARSPISRASNARSAVFRASSAHGSLILFFAVLAGCAGYGPGDLHAGQLEADVRARMGEPTGRYPMPGGGSKIEYARGPMGKHTYMIELDADGRVKGWQQVLTEANFESIAIAVRKARRLAWRRRGLVVSLRCA
jgi:hypothetical protein